MISKPTGRHLQALVSVSRLPEWAEVSKLLDAELAATMDKLLDSADSASTGKYQGRAKLLRDLQKLVVEAPVLLVKVRAEEARVQHTALPSRP